MRCKEFYVYAIYYYHLKQNLVAMKSPVTVLSDLYKPAEKLFVDFAGDRLLYIDLATGEKVSVQVFDATMPYGDDMWVLLSLRLELDDRVLI